MLNSIKSKHLFKKQQNWPFLVVVPHCSVLLSTPTEMQSSGLLQSAYVDLLSPENHHSHGALQTGRRPRQGTWFALTEPHLGKTSYLNLFCFCARSNSRDRRLSACEGWWSRGIDLLQMPVHHQKP